MMAAFDPAKVASVAHLARLKVTAEESKAYADQLSKILAYMDQLNELDTANVPPTAHPIAVTNVLREDKPEASWTSQQALHNAPQAQRGFFKVPKVIEQDEP